MPPDPGLADQLLDAQVAWVVDELTGDRLQAVIASDAATVWAIAGRTRLDALVDADDLTRIARWLLATVPPSTTASTLVQAWAQAVHEGPPDPWTPSEVISRDHVAALVDEVQARTPGVGRRLDRLADSPAVGAIASRFISRIVVDVLQANRTAAERIPGVGSMLSLGSSAASRVMGAAERPLAMVGDTAGKGASYAVRRLNAVVVDTLQDPMLRKAVLEVWDQYADEPVGGLDEELSSEDAERIAGLVQDIVIAAAPSAPVDAMVAALATAFLDVYGEHPVTTLVEELGLSADDIVTELQRLLPAAIAAARADGALEQAVRDRLAPFYASPAVTALLQR